MRAAVISTILSRRHNHTSIQRMSAIAEMQIATQARIAELLDCLSDVRERVRTASSRQPILVAVSKYKPASDVLACFEIWESA
ncbi:hypothetical protein F5887DRAFT_31516 [Amanita rubescens]|nr:hypothetical protein F5887DRAFT_31516 [Amanita rubescens]